MRVWTVHTSPGRGTPRLVREGFSWGALLLGPLWLATHGLWLATLGWLVLAAGVALLPPGIGVAAALGLQLLLGWSARDLQRAALARGGWRLSHVVAAPDADAAELRLFGARPDLLA